MTTDVMRQIITLLENIEGLPSPEDVDRQYTWKKMLRHTRTISVPRFFSFLDKMECDRLFVILNFTLPVEVTGVKGIHIVVVISLFSDGPLNITASGGTIVPNVNLQSPAPLKKSRTLEREIITALVKQLGIGSATDAKIRWPYGEYEIQSQQIKQFLEREVEKLDEIWRTMITANFEDKDLEPLLQQLKSKAGQ